eukprot:NODE_3299_length_432_cov_81.924590_g3249_i0.p1 GENE.NODE_3299_length_432_cov_81.924590_g3249_i0~~NODE_3299_length_432_cov_81.924590_g3249_i0.p1  ORF type:complete len:118 (+),score=15.21 NODE_3299_length_432_cov_81.924590_g3249_i0:73-426(+)
MKGLLVLFALFVLCNAELLHVSEKFHNSVSRVFIQKVCPNKTCQEGCQQHTFHVGECLNVAGGASAKAYCDDADKKLRVEYWQNDSCSGSPAHQESEPLDKCLRDTTGSFFENLCPQ